MRELEVGDVVRLNSGGPMMTVLAVEAGGVVCEWFDANGVTKTCSFPSRCLGPVVGDGGPT